MRLLVCFAVAAALVPESSVAQKRQRASRIFSATAYSVEGQTASGLMAKPGVIAADPDILPLGTQVHITGAGPYSGVYTVADTGRRITGREIDIYIAHDGEAKRFGKKQVRVRVLRLPKPDL